MPTLKRMTREQLERSYAAGERDSSNRDFRGVNLDTLDLSGADFPGSDFTRVHMNVAGLKNCSFAGACFRPARLYMTEFRGTDLSGADFTDAYMRRAQPEAGHRRLPLGVFTRLTEYAPQQDARRGKRPKR